MAITVAGLLTALTAACDAPAIEGTNTTGQAFRVTLVDPDGLVVSASDLALTEGFVGVLGDAVHAAGEPDAIWVTWSGLPCETRPSLAVSREAESIAIAVDRGPMDEGFCSAIESGYGVQLVFQGPVEAESIDFSIEHRERAPEEG